VVSLKPLLAESKFVVLDCRKKGLRHKKLKRKEIDKMRIKIL